MILDLYNRPAPSDRNMFTYPMGPLVADLDQTPRADALFITLPPESNPVIGAEFSAVPSADSTYVQLDPNHPRYGAVNRLALSGLADDEGRETLDTISAEESIRIRTSTGHISPEDRLQLARYDAQRRLVAKRRATDWFSRQGAGTRAMVIGGAVIVALQLSRALTKTLGG